MVKRKDEIEGRCENCRHPSLCKAQGEDFCLIEYNRQRHGEYLKRRREESRGGDQEDEDT